MIDLVKNHSNLCFLGYFTLGEERVKRKANQQTAMISFTKETKKGAKKRWRYTLSKMLVAGIIIYESEESWNWTLYAIKSKVWIWHGKFKKDIFSYQLTSEIESPVISTSLFFILVVFFHNFLGVIFLVRSIVCNLPCLSHLMFIKVPTFM